MTLQIMPDMHSINEYFNFDYIQNPRYEGDYSYFHLPTETNFDQPKKKEFRVYFVLRARKYVDPERGKYLRWVIEDTIVKELVNHERDKK